MRLAQWSGLSRAEFRRRAECVNLLDAMPETFRMPALHAAARALAPRLAGRVVVLLGNLVVSALWLDDLAPWSWTGGVASVGPGTVLLRLPHPSGQNHVWNDAWAREKASRLLHDLFGLEYHAPVQEVLK